MRPGIFVCSVAFVLALSCGDAKKLRLRVATWNVGEGSPKGGLEELAGLKTESPQPDIIVIGMQEITMRPDKAIINLIFDDNWTRALEPELAQWGYKKVKTARLVGILLNVFVHNDHMTSVGDVAKVKVPTGMGGLYGNKGGVSVGMDIYESRVRFVNSHLPAHDGHLKDRLDNFRTISNGVEEEKGADLKFWLGDLNFRLADTGLSSGAIQKKIERGELETLLALDELNTVRAANEAFTEYSEMPIQFKPTFKWIPGKDEYNPKRRPAWTDRILFTASDKLEPLSYTSLEGIKQSDHRPVVADFMLDL